jgi:hypothetical protein
VFKHFLKQLLSRKPLFSFHKHQSSSIIIFANFYPINAELDGLVLAPRLEKGYITPWNLGPQFATLGANFFSI